MELRVQLRARTKQSSNALQRFIILTCAIRKFSIIDLWITIQLNVIATWSLVVVVTVRLIVPADTPFTPIVNILEKSELSSGNSGLVGQCW